MVPLLSPEQKITELRQELAERDATIAAQQAAIAEAAVIKARLTTALLEIEHIKVQVAALRRQRYRQSSEKLDRDIAQLEMRLEDFEEGLGEHAAAKPKLKEVHETSPLTSRPKPSGRHPLPSHHPREIIVHEPEIACHCDSCDPVRLAKLGESKTEVLEKTPAKLKAIEHVRPKYVCRLCEKTGTRAADREGATRAGTACPYRGLKILRRHPALPSIGHPGPGGCRY